jgi:hypothetical protein
MHSHQIAHHTVGTEQGVVAAIGSLGAAFNLAAPMNGHLVEGYECLTFIRDAGSWAGGAFANRGIARWASAK